MAVCAHTHKPKYTHAWLTDNLSAARAVWVSDKRTIGLCMCTRVQVCVWMSVCVCVFVSSRSSISSSLYFISPSLHSITVRTWSLEHSSCLPFYLPTFPPSFPWVLTWYSRDQPEGSEYSESPQSLDIEACCLPSNSVATVTLGGLLQDGAE